MKLLLCLIVLGLTSCSHSRDLNMAKEHEAVKYIFNDEVSFGFKIPSDSIDVLPKGEHISEFSVQDIKSTKQNLFWVLNRTYQKLPHLTFSGKYSVRVGASIADIAELNLSLEQLEQFKIKHYEKQFGLDLQMERYLVKSHTVREWLIKRHAHGKQKTITAYTPLSGRSYLSFTFEYFGEDDKEYESLNAMYRKVLGSFWLKRK